jgi:hypothetical protein
LTQARENMDGRPSGLINGVLAAVDRLPGPNAVWWFLVGAALTIAGHLLVWASEAYPVGTISHDVFVPAFMFAWFAWLIQTLNAVAIRSFDDFRPALGEPEREEAYRLALTTIRDREAVLAGIATIVIVSLFYYVAVRPFRTAIPWEIERISAPLWGLAAFTLGVLIVHTLRQLRMVSRLSAIARNVDIFKPAAINAFSKLTAVSALGLIAFVVAYMLYTPDQPTAYVIQEALVLALAVGSFVLPLRVMHDRLEVEKKRLLGDAQERLKQVLERIHEAVDGNDLARAEQLHHSLSTVLAEVDVLNRLHTWPWSTATIRGFTSALLLPIALIVFTQFIDQLLAQR